MEIKNKAQTCFPRSMTSLVGEWLQNLSVLFHDLQDFFPPKLGVWGSGCIALPIFNLDGILRLVVSVTLRPLNPPAKKQRIRVDQATGRVKRADLHVSGNSKFSSLRPESATPGFSFLWQGSPVKVRK